MRRDLRFIVLKKTIKPIKKIESLTIGRCTDKGSTFSSSGFPAVISDSGRPRENPVLGH